MKVKVLTVKQPWASLIVQGLKDIENRTWKTYFRGRVFIHASLKPVKEGWEALTDKQRLELPAEPEMNRLSYGSIIGSVEIVDCVMNHPSVWAEQGVYHWVLANPILFDKSIENVKGRLGLWDYEMEDVL